MQTAQAATSARSAADVASAITTATTSSGDFALTLKASDIGADPATLRDIVPQMQAEIADHGGLGEAIKQDIAADSVNGAAIDTSDWPSFDGTVAATSGGDGFTVTVPAAEVEATGGFWAWVASTVIGWAAGYGLRVLCIGGLTASGVGAAIIPLVCTPLQTTVTAMVTMIVKHGFDKDLGTPQATRDIIIAGLLGLAGGYTWEKYLAPWAKANLATAFKNFGNWLKAQAPGLTSRFGSTVGDGARAVGDQMTELEELLNEAMRDWGGLNTGTSEQQIAVASYIYPTDPAWDRLIASPSDKTTVVVANVLNGPGSAADSSWARVIDRAAASGKKVLGYVDTGYMGLADNRATRLGSKAAADWIMQIEEDINAWYSLYGSAMGGIFFDDGYNECGTGNEVPTWYHEINNYVKRAHPGAMTVLNPGAIVPQCYEGTADVLLTYEGSYAGYVGSGYQNLGWTPKSPSEIWHIIYDTPADQVQAVAKKAEERGAGYVDITDDTLSNPYDTLPAGSYWTAEQGAVEGGSPSVAPADAYTTGGSTPAAPAALKVTKSDYTSATLTWSPVSGAAQYELEVGSHVLKLPGTMTTATVGGLTPGGKAYGIAVSARAANGDASGYSAPVTVTTMSLPGGKTVSGVSVSASASSTTYSADFLVPYSFHRLYVWSGDGTGCDAPAWPINYNAWNFVCADYMVEGTTLYRYASTVYDGSWSWTPVATVPVTVSGYTYTWTLPLGTSTAATKNFVLQAEGYNTRTEIFSPCGVSATALGGGPDGNGRYCA
ncbi:spherulation-specific family 4 protein [Streptomyces sp. NPDC056160]|uniref:spherulation-specific family 4 protein n=1 Tax=Streptomyces sp. NPDC056160 TaxID=3345731 RepID=UPI0035D57FB8